MSSRYFDSDSDNIPDEDFLEEEGYQTLTEKKPLPRGWFVVPALLVGIVIVVMIAIWFRGTPQNAQSDGRIQQIENRILMMEKRLAELTGIDEKMSGLERDGQAYLQAIERLNRLETTVSMRVERIEKALSSIQTNQAKTQPKTKKVAKPATKKEESITHVVKSGDTLYAISRRYDISIDQLRKDNKLNKNSTINPGQKLIIKKAP
jgi:LysM repeat protein